jgi:hypothetical protein
MAMKSCVFGVAELPEPSRLAGCDLKSRALTEDLEDGPLNVRKQLRILRDKELNA